MPLLERKTERRGRSAVPAIFPRMRLRRLSRACSLVRFIAASRPLSDLAQDDLARVADALALVRLRRPQTADVRRDLADGLLVAPPHDDLRRRRNLELDAVRRVDGDRVGVAEREVDRRPAQVR